MPAAPPPTAAGARLGWADAAKGVCILLVVLHHVTVKHLPSVAPPELAGVVEGWAALTAALKPIRMPLFFLLSGLFAAGAVRRPWSQVLTSRVLNPYWVYAVWLGLLAVVFSVERTLVMNRTQGLGDLVADLAFASTGVWFLYALAVYFVLAKLLLPLDVRPVVAASALLAVSVSALPMADANREAVLVHFVYFLLGARLPELVRLLADRRRPATPLLLGGYVVAASVLARLGTPLSVEVTTLSVLGVPLAVRAARALTELPRLGTAAARLGRRTLPVYVLHMPVLAVVHHLPGPEQVLARVGTHLSWAAPVVVAAYPLLLTAAVTVTSLALHRALLAAGLDGLFALPASLRTEPETLRRAAVRARAEVRSFGRPGALAGRWTVRPDSRLTADPPSHGVTRVLAIR
ncbi:acyltransferase [Nocardioides sp. HDW12B]|uniref:acyltransferase family protein n=1 Tax=Nocardioides sp. HDW12B TaxID=2714939 RepID=UPI0014086F2E|nr:acyltransferase [Nocardioides sp. HDW12B]QIK65356.1 acyltransferase [Nocardioides sp. HDW12B]